jgi:endoglucanase
MMAVNSLTLTWVASTSGSPPITYQPQFRVTGATTFIPFQSPISGTSVVVTGLSAATNYDFDVVAINSVGNTPSAIATGTTSAGVGVAPSAPGNLTVSQ